MNVFSRCLPVTGGIAAREKSGNKRNRFVSAARE